jgi:hypothetical protein
MRRSLEASGRRDLLTLLARTRFYPSFYEPQCAPMARCPLSTSSGVDAQVPVRKAALKTTEAVDPPATGIFTPDTEFGSRFLVEVVRGREPVPLRWAGYNYLPVGRSRPSGFCSRPDRPRHANRVAWSIALCDHPDIERILARLHEMGYGISPASSGSTTSPSPSSGSCARAAAHDAIAPEDRTAAGGHQQGGQNPKPHRADLIFASGLKT